MTYRPGGNSGAWIEEDFPLDFLRRREATDRGEHLGAAAFSAGADRVVALAVDREFIGVAGDEGMGG